MLQRIRDGRTDLVFDYLAQGHAATSADEHGTRLIEWCAYHGDVSAIRFLLAQRRVAGLARREPRPERRGVPWHWQLCQFLVEHGADVNHPLPDTGETPLHAALCKANRPVYDHDRSRSCSPPGPTRTARRRRGSRQAASCATSGRRGETPLHRAAAFGTERASRSAAAPPAPIGRRRT